MQGSETDNHAIKPPTLKQALEAIEKLSTYGMDSSIDGKISEGGCDNPAYKFAAKIYEIAHIARRPPCLKVHKDWIKEFWEEHKRLK